jgi:hypothetical protein
MTRLGLARGDEEGKENLRNERMSGLITIRTTARQADK